MTNDEMDEQIRQILAQGQQRLNKTMEYSPQQQRQLQQIETDTERGVPMRRTDEQRLFIGPEEQALAGVIETIRRTDEIRARQRNNGRY